MDRNDPTDRYWPLKTGAATIIDFPGTTERVLPKEEALEKVRELKRKLYHQEGSDERSA